MDNSYKNIQIDDYTYHLPDERIAKHPLKKRDESKMLIYSSESIVNSTFDSIINLLAPTDLLIFNNTKVVQARLMFTKKTGATIEIFILNPTDPSDYQLAFSQKIEVVWNCIIGNMKRWKGEILEKTCGELNTTVKAQLLNKTTEGANIRFTWDNEEITFAQIIESVGLIPLPPYLNRNADSNDKLRYQTIYAKLQGSVAAPTAGLHFTPSLLHAIEQKGVRTGEVTLHVGAGTFKPIKSNSIGEHEMHFERVYVDNQLIKSILNTKGRIIAVGTTSMRSIERLYWLGVAILEGKDIGNPPVIKQWEPYGLNSAYSLKDSFSALLNWMKASSSDSISFDTQIIIVPGYKFMCADVLVTNFHQPHSTLLLLVAAFVGDDWKKIYQHALNNDYRFLSYGDSSWLEKTKLI